MNANFPGGKARLGTWQYRVDAFLYQLFLKLRTEYGSGNRRFFCPNFNKSDDDNTLYLFRHKIQIGEIHDYNLSNLKDLKSTERPVRHDVFSFRAKHEGVAFVVSARLHHEYFTVTFALDFGQKIVADTPPTFAKSFSTELAAIARSFSELHGVIKERFPHSREGKAANFAEKQKAPADSAHFALVERFRRYVDDYAYLGGEGDSAKRFGIRDCGSLFADFSGAIFSLKPTPDFDQLQLATIRKSAAHSLTIRDQVEGYDLGASDLAHEVIDAAWPIIRRLSPNYFAEELRGKPEYTASLLQRGQVLYISSLGELPPKLQNGKVAPLVYMMVVTYASKWRLGRLVDRLHTLGVLRLAALRDLSLLNDASTEISELSRSIRLPPLKRKISPAEVMKEIREIGADIEGGLMYRVFRSRYYVSSFTENLDALEPIRIEGFPPYNSFVARRVFDAFDYIDRIGVRHGELQQEASFVINSTHRAALEENTNATNRLLDAAELISFIPIGYYSGSILDHSLAGVDVPWATDFIFTHSQAPYFAIGIVFIGLPFAFGRRVREWWQRSRQGG